MARKPRSREKGRGQEAHIAPVVLTELDIAKSILVCHFKARPKETTGKLSGSRREIFHQLWERAATLVVEAGLAVKRRPELLDSEFEILEVLRKASRPMTAAQIAFEIGKSPERVRELLRPSGKLRKHYGVRNNGDHQGYFL